MAQPKAIRSPSGFNCKLNDEKLKQEWRDILREQSLTQQMQQKVMQKVEKITPGQVEQFYKRTDKDSLPIISTGYKLSQICIYPDKKDPVMRVKEQLLSFRDRILKGEKFSTLAISTGTA